MDFEELFIIWAEGPDGFVVLPSGFFDGETAVFWANTFNSLTGADVILDVVDANGFIRHMQAVRFCALISKESFYNAYLNLAKFCQHSGGLAKGSRLAGKPDFDRIKPEG